MTTFPADLVAIAGLLLLSAFFSGSETALTAVSRPWIHLHAARGDPRALRVQRLLDRREQMISAILLGNNLVNILASAIATRALIERFGGAGVVYATVVMTALILVFAEILPKTVAIRHADRIAPWVAIPVAPLVTLLTPLTSVVAAVFRLGGRLGRAAASGRTAREELRGAREELRGAIELAATAGVRRRDRNMLRSVLDLDQVTVRSVMVPRVRMYTLDASQPPEVLAAEVLEHPYTRYPVWENERENIIGILHARKLFMRIQEAGGPQSVEVREVLDQPWYVPDVTTLANQLDSFRVKQTRMALVVDEYGALEGLVTLKDILEDIVGDIPDEFDPVRTLPPPGADRSVVVPGDTSIRDLNRRYDWELPTDGAPTIAGLVIEEAEELPEEGAEVQVPGFAARVLKKDGARLVWLRLRPDTD